MRRADLTGEIFGNLKVVGFSHMDKHCHSNWVCNCVCGNTAIISLSNLKSGGVASCGCKKNIRGGISNTATGSSWQSMMTRCYNRKEKSYASYGAVGICVCEFLRATPVNLVLLIGMRPNHKTIDRVDNYGKYTCGACAECLTNGWTMNVRWATRTEQNRNRRDLNYITIGGVTRCLSEWSEISGVKRSTMSNRFHSGWRGERLLAKAGR